MRIVVDDFLALMREQGHSNGLHVDGNVVRVLRRRAAHRRPGAGAFDVLELLDDLQGRWFGSRERFSLWNNVEDVWGARGQARIETLLVGLGRCAASTCVAKLRSTWGARAVELQGSGRLQARAYSVCWSEG